MTMAKRNIITIILFLGIILFFGLPFTSWWFFGADDYGGVLIGYKATTWHDLLNFFYDGHINNSFGNGPTNSTWLNERPPFFGTYYRPLYCVFLTLQYWLFGSYAYPYFLCNVVFHAFNTALLFLIFSQLTNLLPAILAALLFAAHPQIAYRFGAIVNFHYYVNTALALLIFLAFKKYLDTDKQRYNIAACTLFMISLFTRESSIVLPGIAMLGVYAYTNDYIQLTIKNFFRQFYVALKKTAGLWLVSFAFLALRLFLYPFGTPTASQQNSFVSFITKKIPELKVFIFDLFNLSWLPWGRPLMRGTILCTCLALFALFFWNNNRKLYVLASFAAGFLMLWPALMGPYSPRYFYEAHPFFLAGFIMCCSFYNGTLIRFKKVLLTLLTCLVIFEIGFVLHSFARRSTKHGLLAQATYELVANPAIKNRALCFIGHPTDGFADQNAAIFWILLNDLSIPIFFDSATAITQADANIVQTTKWANIVSNYYEKNYYTTTTVPGGFRFTSINPAKIHFFTENCNYSFGEKIVHAQQTVDGQRVVTDFTLLINEEYLKQNPLFIRWDFETQRFVIMPSLNTA